MLTLRRRAIAFLAVLFLGSAAAGVATALTAPATRVVRRVETREVASLRVGWDWKIRVTRGNAVWPAGTELPPGRPIYPYTGGAVVVAVPEALVRADDTGVRTELRYEAWVGTAREGALVWERPIASAHALGTTGILRGAPLEVDAAAQRQWIDGVNRSLGLEGPYQPTVVFRARLTVSGVFGTRAVTVDAPVRLHPEGLELPPPDRAMKEDTIQMEVTDEAAVPYPMADRLRDRYPWWASSALAAVAVVWLALRGPERDLPRRYRRWIVRGKVDLNPDVRFVEVESVEALVGMAQELGTRVIYDQRVGYVLSDHDVCYLYRPHGGPRLGDLLVQLGVLTPYEFTGLYQQKAWVGRPLGERLIALGLVDKATVYAALAYQRNLVYLEPDELQPIRSIRLPFPAALVGKRPDGKHVVAVCDPAVAPDLLEYMLGEPVEPVVVRPSMLVATQASEDVEENTGEVYIGRAELRVAREHGLTLGLLLWLCNWWDGSDSSRWREPDMTVYRRAIKEGRIHSDVLSLSVAALSLWRTGKDFDVISLLTHARRLPESLKDKIRRFGLDELIHWCFASKVTLSRVKRIQSALTGLKNLGVQHGLR